MIASVYRPLRLGSLAVLRAGGVFERVKNSRWRDERLLILCYHGISLDEEHLWRPATYITPELFKARLEILARGGYAVLPLGEAIDRLYRRALPPRSVAITFDDGTYDFYKHAYPALKQHGFPATVYQTTYYCDYDRPIFNLACSYILWKQRGKVFDAGSRFGLPEIMDLRTETSRQAIVTQLVTQGKDRNLPETEKNQVAEELARAVGTDYAELVEKRVLQLMRPHEVEHLAKAGIDCQLHTHRHRTPMDEALFRREIRDNRSRLQSMIGPKSLIHFCYPSGLYELEFLPWLQAEGVISGTTCDPGFATRENNALLLPRFVDTMQFTSLEFEGWLSGAASLIPRRGNRIRHHPAHAPQGTVECCSTVRNWDSAARHGTSAK
jgi:peptidoglycan/xylan/chitin deacetylase (PgdA/CDA1 family)